MMDMGLFFFASPPRTATTWVRKATMEAGILRNADRVKVHVPHEDRPSSVLRIACVRHPCDWLRSYYTSVYPGKVGVECVDVFRPAAGAKDFDEFVRYVLSLGPGAVGGMFRAYNADVILRVEDLPWAFVEFLESLAVPRKLRERCLSLNRQNPTKPELFPTWHPSLKARVLQSEAEMVDRYEY